MKILLTGANGYIGRAVAEEATRRGVQVIALLRRKPSPTLPCPFLIPSSWSDPVLLAKAMEGCDAIIHCAGLAHGKDGDMNEINVRLTRTLAEAAVKAGIKRFVFISSAAVFGHEGVHKAADPVSPVTPYGQSKVKAERVLTESGLKVSILRPPVVIGKGAPGRSETVRKWAKYPLPFGSLNAQRSYMTLDALADALLKEAAETGPSALIHPVMQTVTATGLIRLMAETDGYKVSLFPFPAFVLKAAAAMLGGKGEALRPLVETHVIEPGRESLDRLV